MNKKTLFCMICLFVCVISLSCYWADESISESNKAATESEFLYESEPDVEFVCKSLDEFKNKINAGDIRSINQDSLENWEAKAKELYVKWYDNGYIPSINGIGNTQLYSYNYSDEMVGISYVEKYGKSDYYYDVILLSEEVQKEQVKDIQEYYINYDEKQDEILNSVGGVYNYINVNDTSIKAAIAEFEDGTKTVDFIWDNKYWIRLWDTQNKLNGILNNFEINEDVAIEPQNFREKDFEGKIKRPENDTFVMSELVEDISVFDISHSMGKQYNKIKEIYNYKIPSVLLADEIKQYYKIESVEYIEKELCYIQYNYIDVRDMKTITIAITPAVYSENNIETYPEIYMKEINAANPYRFDQTMAEKYGIYEMTSHDNINNYSFTQENLPNNVELAFEYGKEDYDYSEYIVLSSNRFIKISCEEELQVEKLKSVFNQIEIVE